MSKKLKAFPHYNELIVLKERGDNSRSRSVWLGFSQIFLNMPRILCVSAIKTVIIGAFLLVLATLFLLFEFIIMPIFIIIEVMVQAFSGRISDKVDGVSLEPFDTLSGKHTLTNLNFLEKVGKKK